jgi:hypothetical protein
MRISVPFGPGWPRTIFVHRLRPSRPLAFVCSTFGKQSAGRLHAPPFRFRRVIPGDAERIERESMKIKSGSPPDPCGSSGMTGYAFSMRVTPPM